MLPTSGDDYQLPAYNVFGCKKGVKKPFDFFTYDFNTYMDAESFYKSRIKNSSNITFQKSDLSRKYWIKII